MAGEGDLVGSAHVDIHVNAGPGEAELAAFKAKVDRDFDELGRKKAEASLNLKKADFDKEIDEAKAQLDYFKRRRASATLDLAKSHFDEQIAAAEAELAALTKKKRTIQVDSRQVKAAHDAERLLAKERALSERSALQGAKAERALTTERERAVTHTIKSRAELAKLSAEYEKLRGRQIAMEKSSRRVFSSKSIGTADKEARRLERVASEADYVKHKIEALGGSVNDLDPQIQKNHTLWGRWLSRLGDTSVRIGPITTSLKGLGTGLSLLGPLIFELGGGLVSLVGTLGEGLAGAAVVSAGALAGLVTSAAGVGFVIGPMVGEFKEVTAASTALHKAELKYGKGSEQVATAQERLNNELHGVSPIAREAFQSLGGLKDQWKELTKGARPDVFNAMGQSIKTAQALLPAFASESTKTTQVAAKAWDGWMQSLRSSEAKGLLKGIMSDFRASIPGLSDGLGSLVAMLGRLSAAGAHFLPGLSNGFAEWADNLEHAVGGGKALQSDVGGLVHQMRDLGHLTQDTGSLLVHIFDASADSGDGLVKSLDNVIKRWDKWTQSGAGKKGLSEFFGDSKTATEDFMSSISHLTRLLFEFSRATAPVANGLLKIVTWIGDLVSAADDLVGVKTVFQGLGVALAGLWVTSKVMAFTGAIQGAAAAMYGLAAGEEAVAAAQASGGIGSLLFGRGKKATTIAETGEDAAKSAAKLGVLEGAAAGTAVELEGATAAATGFGAVLASPLIAPVALAGLGFLIAGLADSETQFEKSVTAFKEGAHEIPSAMEQITVATDSYNASLHHTRSASDAVADARKHLNKVQREGAPVGKQTAAVERLNAAERQQVVVTRERGRAASVAVHADKEGLKAAKARLEAAEDTIDVATKSREGKGPKPSSVLGQGLAGAYRKEGQAAKEAAQGERERAQVMRELPGLERAVTLSRIPFERQAKNLVPLTHQAAAGLREMAKAQGQNVARKVGNFVDPKDIERVTALGNRLTKLGRGGQVKNIAVKSQGADQTISKLQRLQKQTNRVEGSRATIKVGANDTQAQTKLKRLGALSQRISGTKQTVHILANSSSAEQAIQRLKQHLTQVVTRQYKAELKAEDKSGAAASAFHHNVSRVSTQKYQARITAIDDASAKAKTAEGNAKRAGQQKPKINITASNAQALGAISSVQGALSALPSSKTVTVTVNTVHTGGKAEGGTSFYMPQPVIEPGGRSRRVNRPTMLTGEEAPRHPEYVIATNPAYRPSNEKYLEDAAGELGYEVIPAYKKGKGKKAGSKKSSSSSTETAEEKRAKTLANHPPNPKHRSHKIAKVEKWGPVAAYNAAETDAQIKEEIYGQVFAHDESEIKAGRMDNWEFGRLRGLLSDQVSDYHKLSSLIPNIRDTVNQELGRIHGMVDGKGEFSKSSIRGLTRGISKEKAKLSKLKQGKNESDAAFRKRKRPYEHSITQQETEQHKKEKERDRLLEIKTEARQELSEVSGAKKMNEAKTNAERSEDELQYIADVETGVVEAPYAEEAAEENLVEESEEYKRAKADLVSAELAGSVPGEESARQHMIEIAEREYAAAKQTASPEDDIDVGERLKSLKEETKDNGGKGTIGEQTASFNEAREQLYQQFASNIVGQLTPTARAGAAAIGASGGHPTYVPGGKNSLAAATPNVNPIVSTSGAKAGKIEVVNNFAAPPPDPMTWTAQQSWELSNL